MVPRMLKKGSIRAARAGVCRGVAFMGNSFLLGDGETFKN
jgi:hypothetical protein